MCGPPVVQNQDFLEKYAVSFLFSGRRNVYVLSCQNANEKTDITDRASNYFNMPETASLSLTKLVGN